MPFRRLEVKRRRGHRASPISAFHRIPHPGRGLGGLFPPPSPPEHQQDRSRQSGYRRGDPQLPHGGVPGDHRHRAAAGHGKAEIAAVLLRFRLLSAAAGVHIDRQPLGPVLRDQPAHRVVGLPVIGDLKAPCLYHVAGDLGRNILHPEGIPFPEIALHQQHRPLVRPLLGGPQGGDIGRILAADHCVEPEVFQVCLVPVDVAALLFRNGGVILLCKGSAVIEQLLFQRPSIHLEGQRQPPELVRQVRPLPEGLIADLVRLAGKADAVHTCQIVRHKEVAAVFPGTSRSGATIIGGLILGLSRTIAAEFTFYLAIPVMFGASLIKVIKFGLSFSALEAGILISGMLVAFVVSLFVIKFLMGYIKKHDFKVFGWYRIVLGALVLVYFAIA
mgnify:CR=1 FL=1